MREILATPQFRKDLRRIPSNYIRFIDTAVQRLQINPLDSTENPKKLRGIKPSVWRVRIGAYRLLYSFTSRSLILLRVNHRKDIYKNL